MPEDTLKGHLTFALKYEGIELEILKKLFEKLDVKEIMNWLAEEPTGQYTYLKSIAIPCSKLGYLLHLKKSGIYKALNFKSL